ncbi:MAG: hypothetical protein FJ144_14315 [Deltaproteobacteria bacterium]|nr:hypothetical protein [Deltaproteobacteria bacterium]
MSATTLTAWVLAMGVGLSLGALGGGGAVLTVPILVYVTGMGVREAVAISLVVVGATSIAGFVAHLRRGDFHPKAAILFSTTGMVASYVGSSLTGAVSERVLLLLFAALMTIVGLAMLREPPARDPATQCRTTPCLAIGTIVGLLTGFLGVGGGFLIVPALVLLAAIETRVAIGTSLAVIAFNSVAGLLGQLRHGGLDWSVALGFLAFSLAGMGSGMRLARRVSPTALRRAFAWLIVVLGVCVAGVTAAPRAACGEPAAFGAAIEAELVRRAAVTGLDPHVRQDVEALHGDRSARTLWTDEGGHPSAEARSALQIIALAGDDGLDPDEYGLASLSAALDALTTTSEPAPAQVASVEVALSTAVVALFHHLHFGRVEPRSLGLRLAPAREGHDIAVLIRGAVAHQTLADAAAKLRPPLAQYARLRAALALYRRLASDRSLDAPLPDAVVRPGDRYTGLGALVHRLTILADLAPRRPGAPAPETYDADVAGGVRRFQRRHGLAADGIVGPATLGALNVPPADRVRQIELALERLRWLPDLEGRLLVINIPMFHLWGWSSGASDPVPAIEMKVIVGRALQTRTPVFTASLERVIFRPFWNVPASITRSEILPKLARDPGYLERERLELVRGPGVDAPVVAATAAHLAELRRGELRLRQRQGPANSLGLVKFDFPNASDVYLHGTPAHQLFARPRRDFSHGCIRAEDPASLASWVLEPLGSWPRERVDAAMHGSGPPLGVRLPEPITVVLFYTTVVAASDGTIRFAEDIYGHDAALARALRSDD